MVKLSPQKVEKKGKIVFYFWKIIFQPPVESRVPDSKPPGPGPWRSCSKSECRQSWGQPHISVRRGRNSWHCRPGPDLLDTAGRTDQSSVLHSHWSRNVEAWLSLVERIIVLLRQLSYAIKNQLVASKAPYYGLWNAKYPHWGVFCLLLAGSLWHKRAGVASL